MPVGAPTLREAEALIGRPYCPRTADCMHLAMEAQRVLWGREVGWPADAVHPARPSHQAAMLMAHRAALARRLPDGAAAPAGSAVLFEVGGQWHIGTLLLDDCGRRWCLHVRDDGCGSRIEPLERMAARGMHPEGFYEWTKTTPTPRPAR